MIIKVCGIRDQENHAALSAFDLDMIGLNFFESSKRYIGSAQLEKKGNQIRVGVFVKPSLTEVLSSQRKHHLDYAQLHGDESAYFSKEVQSHLPIIKVFRIDTSFDWEGLKDFSFADYFLFDTMTSAYGGSGKKFNWSNLEKYALEVPFLLSGGIGPEDAAEIKELDHPSFAGIDINSQFELSPAYKDPELVARFIKEMRN